MKPPNSATTWVLRCRFGLRLVVPFWPTRRERRRGPLRCPAVSFASMNRAEPFSAAADSTGRVGRGRRPAWFMLGSVGCYVGLPLTIYWGVQTTSPLLFTAVSYLLGCGVYTAAVQASRTVERGFKMAQLVSAVKRRYLLSDTLLLSNWFLFAAAVTLAPATIVTVLFELWGVLFAVLCLSGWWRRRMHDSQVLDRSAATTTLIFMTVGFVGVALAVLSDAGSQDWSWAATVGIGMALLAAATTAAATAVEQMMGKRQHGTKNLPETQVSTAGEALSRGSLGGLMLAGTAVWWLTGGPIEASWSGLRMAVLAAGLDTCGNWLFQHANHLARHREGQSAPQINSLYYLVPVGAVALLAWLTDSAVARPALLICGVAGVVAVNMVMHLDPEGASQRAHPVGGHGFKALVLTVWGCGTAVVSRDYWLPARWQVWSVAEYWGMVGVLATVFVLMLSFRQERLMELCCAESRPLHDVPTDLSLPLR